MNAQGRGAQRLVLVAVLLRLARALEGVTPVGGFEEPEEALEPLRQSQLSRMLSGIVAAGGQIFVVTHSPEIVRAFTVEDVLLLPGTGGGEPRSLVTALSLASRRRYERWLDGPVVRALFARVPVLVEGPGDRVLFATFWRALAETGQIPHADQLGLDPINCEGDTNQPTLASVLDEAGKAVVAWAERDVPDTLERLQQEGHCAALLLHDARAGRQNLEGALAHGCSLVSLAHAMTAAAEDRDCDWPQQRTDLVARAGLAGADDKGREMMKTAASLLALLEGLPEPVARALVASALGGKEDRAPFAIKGARPARVFAEAIVSAEGVPGPFASAFRGVATWIVEGCPRGRRIELGGT